MPAAGSVEAHGVCEVRALPLVHESLDDAADAGIGGCELTLHASAADLGLNLSCDRLQGGGPVALTDGGEDAVGAEQGHELHDTHRREGQAHPCLTARIELVRVARVDRLQLSQRLDRVTRGPGTVDGDAGDGGHDDEIFVAGAQRDEAVVVALNVIELARVESAADVHRAEVVSGGVEHLAVCRGAVVLVRDVDHRDQRVVTQEPFVGTARLGLGRDGDERCLELLLEAAAAGAQGGDATEVVPDRRVRRIGAVVGPVNGVGQPGALRAGAVRGAVRGLAAFQAAHGLENAVVAVHGVVAGHDGVTMRSHVGRDDADVKILDRRRRLGTSIGRVDQLLGHEHDLVAENRLLFLHGVGVVDDKQDVDLGRSRLLNLDEDSRLRAGISRRQVAVQAADSGQTQNQKPDQ